MISNGLTALTDSTQPLVAVATPVYNGGRMLAAAMACVQAQTYPNLVHVVLDNASTDETAQVIERYKNGRVPIITQRNPATLPVQKNWSATAALVPKSAKYFQMLCADDEIAPDSISEMVELAESDPAIELVGCIQKHDGEISPPGLPEDGTVFDGRTIVRTFLNKQSNDIPHMFGFFRRHDEDFTKDFFDETLLASDTDACLRALSRGKFGFVQKPLFNMRRHENQLTKTIAKKNQARVIEPLVLIERWGPLVMTSSELNSCRGRHLRAIYRHMLLWRLAGGGDLYRNYVDLLKEHRKVPGLPDFALSALEWPFRLLDKHARNARLQVRTVRRNAGGTGSKTRSVG